jgi:hypothetical protein
MSESSPKAGPKGAPQATHTSDSAIDRAGQESE